ncbi:MAG: DUF1800 domain-containing protein [Herminiimonas sp.]|nr:DUF1800 domain-containing protein [Herminiimonas sp.]
MKWVAKLLLGICTVVIVGPVSAAGLSEQQRALHVLNRIGYGPKPGDVELVVNVGVERYIEAQLDPRRIPLPSSLSERLGNLTVPATPAGELLAQFMAAQKAGKDDGEDGKQMRRATYQRIAEQTAEARLARAIDSPRQLEEVMVDFWFNHFNVFAGKGLDRGLVTSYERDAIRPFALGRFRDLLGATAKHPAMLFYLDNWVSVASGYQPDTVRKQGAKASGLNENYARELMELHTLGVDGGYGQTDVTELARMFTGWTFNPRDMMRGGRTFAFDLRRHDSGDKHWLGHQVSAHGQDEGEWALDVLASHPATARHISYKLAQYFVADEPPASLVKHLSERFVESKGDITAVLRTLLGSPEFWSPDHVGTKFKTPYQYVVSTARAAEVDVKNIRPLLGTLAQLGMPLYGCPTPDGYKNTEQAWLNPDALTRRINFATALASGRLALEKPVDQNDMNGMGKRQLERMTRSDDSNPDRSAGNVVDAGRLMATLGSTISQRTRSTVANNPLPLRAALLLGSPDFMRH